MAAQQTRLLALLILQVLLLDLWTGNRYLVDGRRLYETGQVPRGHRAMERDYGGDVEPSVMIPGTILYHERPRVVHLPLLLKINKNAEREVDTDDLIAPEDYPRRPITHAGPQNSQEQPYTDPQAMSSYILERSPQHLIVRRPYTPQSDLHELRQKSGRQHEDHQEISEDYTEQLLKSPQQYSLHNAVDNSQKHLLLRPQYPYTQATQQDFLQKRHHGGDMATMDQIYHVQIPHHDYKSVHDLQSPKDDCEQAMHTKIFSIDTSDSVSGQPELELNEESVSENIIRQRRFGDTSSDNDADSSMDAWKYERLRNSLRYKVREPSRAHGKHKPHKESDMFKEEDSGAINIDDDDDDDGDGDDVHKDGDIDRGKESKREVYPVSNSFLDLKNMSTHIFENIEEIARKGNDTRHNRVHKNQELSEGLDKIKEILPFPHNSNVKTQHKQKLPPVRGRDLSVIIHPNSNNIQNVFGHKRKVLDDIRNTKNNTRRSHDEKEQRLEATNKGSGKKKRQGNLRRNDVRSESQELTFTTHATDKEGSTQTEHDVTNSTSPDHKTTEITSFKILDPSEIRDAKIKIGTMYELLNRFRILGKAYSTNFLQFIHNKVPVLYPKIKSFPNGYDESGTKSTYKDLLQITKNRLARKLYLQNSHELQLIYEPNIFSSPDEKKWTRDDQENYSQDKYEDGDVVLADLLANVRSSLEVSLHLANQVDSLLMLVTSPNHLSLQLTQEAKVHYKNLLLKYMPSVEDIVEATKDNKDQGDINDKAVLLYVLAQHRIMSLLLYNNVYTLISAINSSLPENDVKETGNGRQDSEIRLLRNELESGTENSESLIPSSFEPPETNIREFGEEAANKFSKYVANQVKSNFRKDVSYVLRYFRLNSDVNSELDTNNLLIAILTNKAKDVIKEINFKTLLPTTGISNDSTDFYYNYATKEATKQILNRVIPTIIDSCKRVFRKEAEKLISSLSTNNSQEDEMNELYEEDNDNSNSYSGLVKNVGPSTYVLSQYKPLQIESIYGGFKVGNEIIDVDKDVLIPALRLVKYINSTQNPTRSTGKQETSAFFKYIMAKLMEDLFSHYQFDYWDLKNETSLAAVLLHYYFTKKSEDVRKQIGTMEVVITTRSAPEMVHKFSQLDIDVLPPFMDRTFRRENSHDRKGFSKYYGRQKSTY